MTPLPAELICDRIGKTFHSQNRDILALEDVSFRVRASEFLAIVGPSGCGKSTLLKIIAGLLEPSTGQIQFPAAPSPAAAGRPKPHSAMVFQEHGLFPWMNILDNVAFGMEMRCAPKAARGAQAHAFLQKFGIDAFAENFPHELSVGMRQRAALARAFLTDPQILLMDEPFSALDAQSKMILQEELLRIWKDDRKTVIYVTHDIDEAVLLADRVLVMSGRPGCIREEISIPLGRPRTLQDPRTAADSGNHMAHLASNRERRSGEFAAPALTPPPTVLTRAARYMPRRRVWVSLLILILLILVWEWAVAARILVPVLFSPPSIIAETIASGLADGSLTLNVAATLGRVFIGLLIGGGAGVLVGLLMGWSRALRENTDPWIAAAHAIPKVAILPLLIFFLGIGEEPKITLAALVAFFPMLINTMAGVGQITPIHFQVAKNYGAHLPQLFLRVIFPGSLPLILSGLRIAFNTTLLTMIAVEMVSGSVGLGVVIWHSWETLQVELLWSSLVVSAIIGITFNFLLLYVTRRLVPWQVQQQV